MEGNKTLICNANKGNPIMTTVVIITFFLLIISESLPFLGEGVENNGIIQILIACIMRVSNMERGRFKSDPNKGLLLI